MEEWGQRSAAWALRPTTRTLFVFWNEVRVGRLAPDSLEIEPSRIAAILSETFMLQRADASGEEEEEEEPHGTDPARHRTAERQQPSRVDQQMGEVAVHQHVGEEARQRCQLSTRQSGGVTGKARGNKRHRHREPDILFRWQRPAHKVNGKEQPQEAKHDARRVEDRLARRQRGRHSRLGETAR